MQGFFQDGKLKKLLSKLRDLFRFQQKTLHVVAGTRVLIKCVVQIKIDECLAWVALLLLEVILKHVV
jgi:hypothetical protein